MSIIAAGGAGAGGGAGVNSAIDTYHPVTLPVITADPLSIEKKRAIFSYIEKNCTPLFSAWSERNPTVTWKQLKGKDDLFHTMKSSLLSPSERRSFEIFQATLKQPLLTPHLGLTPSLKAEEVAARIFIRTLLKMQFRSNTMHSLEDVDAMYQARISGVGLNSPLAIATTTLSPKYSLLMESDPVLADMKSPATPVNILLSRTFFLTDPAKTREETRMAIRHAFESLAENPETHHVIDALAHLFQTQKGAIFIGNSPCKIGKIGSTLAPHDATGGFCRSHTLFCTSLSYSDDVLRTRSKAFLMHESLHFIFGNIVNNNHSPTPAGSEQERLLDEALAKDREYRRTLVIDKKTSDLWEWMTSALEKSLQYFPPKGFDPTNPAHLHTMRVESIVRIVQVLTLGEDRERVRAVAPNLFDFYMTYSKPMIEAYTAAHAAPTSRGAAPTLFEWLAKLFEART